VVKKIIIIIIVIIAAVVAYKFLFETEEDKVKKQFTLFSELAEKEPGESNLIMARKSRKIGALVTDPVMVTVPEYKASGSYARQEITRRMAMGRTRFIELSLEFFDLSVEIIDETNAEANVTAQVTGKKLNKEPFEGTHELLCRLQKVEEEWLFNRVEVVDVLEK
jgi:hypothetical protein